MPNFPIFTVPATELIPTTIDVKTRGTITIFSNRINISPSGINILELSRFDTRNPKKMANNI